ncbi:MAG TPA: hypothetical protein VFG87_15550 [Amycolatopsis sp.]|jgi:hypothetical protein|nr:hypothetical protein [Amycolatopsis sp.]
MRVSTTEFAVQEADLLPAREGLQTGPWDMILNTLQTALGSQYVPAAQSGSTVPASHPGVLYHGGQQPIAGF